MNVIRNVKHVVVKAFSDNNNVIFWFMAFMWVEQNKKGVHKNKQ